MEMESVFPETNLGSKNLSRIVKERGDVVIASIVEETVRIKKEISLIGVSSV